MATFDPLLFIKSCDELDDVIVFLKSPEQRINDSKNGISRFGGNWRSPSYLHAYLRAAAVLVEHGVKTNSLDDIGLPAFYMQRHVTELLIKRLLSWLYELAELRAELGLDCQNVPSNIQKKNFKRSHKLTQLFDDLSLVSKYFGFAEPPAELGELVQGIANFEKSETWARYEQSETSDGTVIHHVQDEIALPLVDLQRSLEQVISSTTYQSTGEPTYENEIYDEWLNAARFSGRAG